MGSYNSYLKWVDKVESSPELDGGGRLIAPVFGEKLCNEEVDVIYEWCCGPAWIGFWLLELGIGKELVVSDINSKAIECVEATAKDYNVRYYISDNLKGVPDSEEFDIVVANPPNYCNIQTAHSYGFMRYDLRPSDIGWRIHKDFYKTIGNYLKPNGKMYISEVEPYRKEVYILNELYDLRERPPIEDFKDMLSENGFVIDNVIPYNLGMLELGILEISRGL